MSDAELVEKARAGDRAAFDQLMQRYEREMIGVAYRMLGHSEDAVDLAQEVFLRAWRSLAQFRGEASFRSWLYRIALNLARNKRRWYARHQTAKIISLNQPADETDEETMAPIEVIDPSAGPRANAQANQFQEAVRQALETLPPEFRETVILRDIQGLSYEEIAQATGQAIGTVRSRLSRGRNGLREALKGIAR
jgi:RNA polymerase sigma-70 factor (ECF subfamily)